MGRDRASGSSSQDTRHNTHQTLSSSFRSSSPLAEQYLARDIADCSDQDVAVDDALSDAEPHDGGHFMYRRPSGVAYGGTRPVLNPQTTDDPGMSPLERKQSRDAERSLLRDNRVLPPKHPERKPTGLASRMYRRIFSTKLPQRDEENPSVVVQPPTETSPLLSGGEGAPNGSAGDDVALDQQWEQAVAEGRIRTTWQRETKTLAEYSWPLIITFFLQYSINVASIFAVGRIGKSELGAVSGKPPLISPSYIPHANPDPSGQHVGRHHLPRPFPGHGH